MEDHWQDWPEKKLQIIEATITVAAAEGVDRATTAKIAREAKAGEGTIYRYFATKDQLIATAALYTGSLVFGLARKNYQATKPVQSQYLQFVHDFLRAGESNQRHLQFMEQYVNSPQGIAYRKKTIAEVMVDPELKPIFFPLNRILHLAIMENLVKPLPFPFLVAMTMGPISFILKHSAQGFMELHEDLIRSVAGSCWDAIRK